MLVQSKGAGIMTEVPRLIALHSNFFPLFTDFLCWGKMCKSFACHDIFKFPVLVQRYQL